MPLASDGSCWVLSKVSNGSSWLLTALFIPNEKAIRRRWGPSEQTNGQISLQQGSTPHLNRANLQRNRSQTLHLHRRGEKKHAHGCAITFLSKFGRRGAGGGHCSAAAAVIDAQPGVKPPLVQTARLCGAVRNFKHPVVCQNSREKI